MGSVLCRNHSACNVAASENRRPGCIVRGEQNQISYTHGSLLHLPREVAIFFVLPLLSVKSLVRLDSALNGEAISVDIYVQLRLLYGCESNCTAIGNLRKEAWLLSRHIYPANIKVFCGLNNKEVCRKRDIGKGARVVSLNYCWMLSAQAIATFLVGCVNVTRLDLSYCFVKAPALNAIAFNCPQLMALSLCGAQKVSSPGLEMVMQRCARLVELKLSNSSGLTYHSVVHIAADLSVRLHTLHLSGLTHVTSVTLSHLKCPALTDLDVSHCNYVLGVVNLVARAGCASLRVLNAACGPYGGGPIQNAMILALAAACPDLQELDLSGYAHLYSDAVLVIVQQFPQLRRLALDRCRAVTDAVLLGVAEHAKDSLRELSVRNCPDVTAAGAATFYQRRQCVCRIHYGEFPDTGL